MSRFDDIIRQKAKEEADEIPNTVKLKIEQTLEELPEKAGQSAKIRVVPKAISVAACFAAICLIIMPNCSTAYAQALEKIPVIGKFVKVVTIRNYFYADDRHEMKIDVPQIQEEHNDAVDYINKNVEELTKILVDRFYMELEEIGDQGYSSIYVDYEVVTNSEKWFTLRIRVHEAAGSSNTYYKYYHIDKRNGKIAQLSDLAATEEFYTIIESEIKRQMRAQMDADSNIIYWVDSSEFGWDFVALDKDHNFYWDEQENLVIAFDKYEVAPGSMGTPEFTISRELLTDVLASQQ